MNVSKKIKSLCPPALFYLVLSMFSLIMVIFQNMGHHNSYHMGSFSCKVPSTVLVIILKLIYILFWTWVLHLICKAGHEGLSWFLVLFPWIILFLVVGLLVANK